MDGVVVVAAPALSVTFTVGVKMPVAPVTVPLIQPEELIDSPAGNGPEPGLTRDHVYGVAPPLAHEAID